MDDCVMRVRPTDPLWVDFASVTYPPVDRDLNADAVVIGAGIAGVAAAYWLRKAGVRDVVVLEARTVAAAASGRNAGFVMAVAPENFPVSGGAEDLAAARRIWAFTAENQRLMERTIAEHGLDTEYRRLGSLGLAAYPNEWEWMQASTEVARGAGLQVALIERDDLEPAWVRDNYLGGAWYPGNAEIHPGKFVRGLAGALARDGVRFFEGSPIERLASGASRRLEPGGGGDHVTIGIGRYTVRARQVVVATNAYTSTVLPGLGSHIRPTRGQVLSTRPVSRTVAPFPVYANDGFQYWRQTPDGRLVLGGWRDLDMVAEVGTAEELNPEIQAVLTNVAQGLTGGEAQIERRWSGIMGFTPDRRPLVGCVPGLDGIAICAGFSGHGLAMAFNCARVAVTALHRGTTEEADLFAPGRFDAGFGRSRTSEIHVPAVGGRAAC
jgi:glycine/D-amino acid oxidase-like deaminating enzyme